MPLRFFHEESALIRMPFRPSFRRTALVPAAFGAAIALAAFTYPGGMACAYEDFRDLESHRKQMSECAVESHHYDATIVNLGDRLAMKDQFIGDLIAGRATLRETTARFMELNRSNEIASGAVEGYYPGDSYEEKAARNVIAFATGCLRTVPAPSNTSCLLYTSPSPRDS